MSNDPILSVAKLIATSVANDFTAKLDQMIGPLRWEAATGQQRWAHSLELAGRQACWQLAQRRAVDTLADVELRVFSQWGEDGIIEWLIQNLPIEHETFIEVGVGGYLEANTRFLLVNRNWRGLIVDSHDDLKHVPGAQYYWRHDLTCGQEFVTRDNVDALFAKYGFSGDIGLLSLDIDGNDYWVLERLGSVRPAILVCEYNAMFGDLRPLTVPYDSEFSITKHNNSMLYFGASIAAMRRVVEAKGYVFVGTNSNGVNAFFVRDDLAPHLDGKLRRRVAWPALHRCCVDPEGRLATRAGMARLDLIRDMPVVDLDTGATAPLGSLEPLFSADWLKRVGHRSP